MTLPFRKETQRHSPEKGYRGVAKRAQGTGKISWSLSHLAPGKLWWCPRPAAPVLATGQTNDIPMGQALVVP